MVRIDKNDKPTRLWKPAGLLCAQLQYPASGASTVIGPDQRGSDLRDLGTFAGTPTNLAQRAAWSRQLPVTLRATSDSPACQQKTAGIGSLSRLF
jgi:hypothetical protein